MDASKLSATASTQAVQASQIPSRTQREQASQPAKTPAYEQAARQRQAGPTTNGVGQTIGGTLNAVA